MARKICVVTGTRAEYGLLRPLLLILKNDPEIELQLIVTGSHLSAQHGSTVNEIEADDFTPSAKLPVDLADDSKLGVAKVMAHTTSQIAESFSRLTPDVVVLLGDRYEILAAAQAALIIGIPVAHIHGGEVTTGAFDDSIRHAITKMSSLHFVAAQEYARRVVQLGEQPSSVFNVGSLGVEIALKTEPISREDLRNSLNIELNNPILLVTYHPTTRSSDSVTAEIDQVLSALNNFSYCSIVFTGVNADPGNLAITNQIKEFVQAEPKSRSLHQTLGQHKYLSLLSLCDVVVGNSSSGIIEAPAFGKPTVNIGSRQNGRLRADSIIDVGVAKQEIQTAIETALSSTWRERCLKSVGAYGSGNTTQDIADTLKSAELNLHKIFFDLS
ncbi:MAG: UDP-N-acetylglucosamine 2-epimerase [Actinomycetota bacterium]|nr:UDP-N-acetylglucosamine 2-epimerase [Actinomycetota bacterium]